MALTTLLSPLNASLTTMTLQRLQLDRAHPVQSLVVSEEMCLYALIGTVRIQMDGLDYGSLGTRHNVGTLSVQAFRVQALEHEDAQRLILVLESRTADVLVVTVPCPNARRACSFLHRDDVLVHSVGTGTHLREVRELVTPPGYTLHMGETLNIQGGWSSWPPHATPEEVARYAEHEEFFFPITPGYGLCRFEGRFATGEWAHGVREVRNGQAFVTPLGRHEIVFSPDAWGWYAWGYRSFLTKTYNQYSEDGIRTYRK